MEVFDMLKAMLDENGIAHKVMEHEAEGRSEAIAAIRGTAVGQGAKALVCRVKISANKRSHVLAVFPADKQEDLEAIAAAAGGKKASLASRDLARELTGCEIGAIPPFTFNDDLALLVDDTLGQRYDQIVFNAGRLDRSILMNAADYLALVKPQRAQFTRESAQSSAEAALS
jgi:Ala-tRNA(Pro) deacylase